MLLLLLVAAGFLLWQRTTAVPGSVAMVSIVQQENESGFFTQLVSHLTFWKKNNTAHESKIISLAKDGEYKIEGKLPVTLEVKEGKIRFVRSVCPDHVCEGVGWIGTEGEQAICMPAGVSVTIQP